MTDFQHGLALILTLILLLLITLLAVSGVRMTTMEARLIRNQHDRAIAFEAAEAALVAAETILRELPETTDFRAFNGCMTTTAGTFGGFYGAPRFDEEPRWRNAVTWNPKHKDRKTGKGCHERNQSVELDYPDLAAPPVFIVEHIDTQPLTVPSKEKDASHDPVAVGSLAFFRITSRGTGANVGTQVYLQSTYARLFRDSQDPEGLLESDGKGSVSTDTLPVVVDGKSSMTPKTGRLSWVELLPDN